MRSFRDAKTMAKALRESLAKKDTHLSHGEALELVAAQFGYDSWNVLAAKIAADSTEPEPGGAISFEQAIPIIRIFDIAKAKEFYFGFLGFATDWEHRFGEGFPLYTQISRAGLQLHLSEHHGDASPGGTSFIRMRGLRAFHAELMAKHYAYMKPGIEEPGWGLEITVLDPFGNRLRFCEQSDATTS
ncbi:glyoxalase superfamily protein [Phreatobacter stygius]|uniref:VOC family protein n=1 Tax=Phreatobacter stygius TaxID=1940610 RepID=A0A4D7B560_9HYPH|nr:glyoxalase superfamily protein [Phreatobacter stygius]QCI65578.1 VOC family protein [Phreatobacter stygius]